jgi:hypothetical protein
MALLLLSRILRLEVHDIVSGDLVNPVAPTFCRQILRILGRVILPP